MTASESPTQCTSLDQLATENLTLKGLVSDFNEEMSVASNVLQNLMKSHVAEREEFHRRHLQARNSFARLREVNAKKDVEINDLKVQLTEKCLEMVRLKSQLSSAESEVTQLKETHLKSLEQKLECSLAEQRRLTAELESSEKKLAGRNEKLESVDKQLSDERDNLNFVRVMFDQVFEVCEQQKKQIDVVTKEKDDLRSELDSKCQLIHRLADQTAKYKLENRKLSAQLSRDGTQRDDRRKLSERVNNLERQLSEIANRTTPSSPGDFSSPPSLLHSNSSNQLEPLDTSHLLPNGTPPQAASSLSASGFSAACVSPKSLEFSSPATSGVENGPHSFTASECEDIVHALVEDDEDVGDSLR